MRIIIIEDEKPSARRLQRMLEKLDVKVETLLYSVEESIDWFQNNPHPDLIFLDIQLSDGLSFEIFEVIDIQSAVIFTTAYDAYALEAFKLNSIDYLLKPIALEDLDKAMEKFKRRISNSEELNLDLNTIRSLLVSGDDTDYKKRFSVKVGQHIKLVNTQDIECFYSENKGTYLFTSEGRNYLLDTTLEGLETMLDPKVFFRINRKYVININSIQDIISYTNSRLQIKLKRNKNTDIIVARERVRDFKNWLE